MDKNRTWTIIDLLSWCTDYLQEKKFQTPRTNCELLLAHTLGVRRLDLYLSHDRVLTGDELGQFKTILKRRIRREPIQYITGETEFMSLPFLVGPGVFIPRPETEHLVEAVMDRFQDDSHALRILEIGTGSGCIAVSLATYLPAAVILATDINEDALIVARENAVQNRVDGRITFIRQSLIDMPPGKYRDYDVLISNPPYVSQEEFALLDREIRDFEPPDAVHDSRDGYSFFPALCTLALTSLRTGGMLVMEMGKGECPKVREIVQSSGFDEIRIRDDYAKIPRVITAVHTGRKGI